MNAVSIFSVLIRSSIFVGSGSELLHFTTKNNTHNDDIRASYMKEERTKFTDFSFQSFPIASLTIGVEAKIFLFVSLVPFGRPVVPEV